MSLDDQLKWDRKYTESDTLRMPRDPSPLLKQFMHLAPISKALDVACGTGRNTLYLAKSGFEVDALDISPVALQELSQHMEKATDLDKIHTKLTDLEQYEPESASYGLIIQANFLMRPLIPMLADALVKGGVLIIETYMQHEGNEKTNSNTDYLLKRGELKTFFDDKSEILHYDEYWNQGENYRMRKQAIVVKKLSSL